VGQKQIKKLRYFGFQIHIFYHFNCSARGMLRPHCSMLLTQFAEFCALQ